MSPTSWSLNLTRIVFRSRIVDFDFDIFSDARGFFEIFSEDLTMDHAFEFDYHVDQLIAVKLEAGGQSLHLADTGRRLEFP